MRKEVVGYEGTHWITEEGDVFSRTRKLRLNTHCSGYIQVDLCRDGSKKSFRLHRLLAINFIPNPHNLPEVNHKNGIKNDNRLSNLEWCSSSDNVKHSYNVLGRKSHFQTNNPKPWEGKFGKDNPSSKPVLQLKGGHIVKRWNSASDAGRSGFCVSHISSCCNGRREAHRGYKWQYGVTR